MSKRKPRATSAPTVMPPADPAHPSPAAVIAPAAATAAERIRELRTALPGVDAEFLLRLFEADMPLDQARDAWLEELLARNAKARAELDELQKRKG